MSNWLSEAWNETSSEVDQWTQPFQDHVSEKLNNAAYAWNNPMGAAGKIYEGVTNPVDTAGYIRGSKSQVEQIYNEAVTSFSGRYRLDDMKSWNLRQIADYVRQLEADNLYQQKPQLKSKHFGLFYNKYMRRMYGSDQRSGDDGGEAIIRQMSQSINDLANRMLSVSEDQWESQFS